MIEYIELLEQVNLDTLENNVEHTLTSLKSSADWLNFMIGYTSWNTRFANGVSALASKISEHKECFIDQRFPVIVADRSNYIASFIFDAARDEYDDHHEKHRDSHRCLGQSTILGMAEFFKEDLNKYYEPQWLKSFNKNVMDGYLGIRNHDHDENGLPIEYMSQIFAGMGYHWCSELVASEELIWIDRTIKDIYPDLLIYLLTYQVTFAGGSHKGYAWLNHKYHQEAQHAVSAFEGIQRASELLTQHQMMIARHSLKQGIKNFLHDHQIFNQKILSMTSK